MRSPTLLTGFSSSATFLTNVYRQDHLLYHIRVLHTLRVPALIVNSAPENNSIYDKISFYLFLLFFRISDSFQVQPEFQFLDTSFKNNHTCYNGSYCFQYHSILPVHKTNCIPSYCQKRLHIHLTTTTAEQKSPYFFTGLPHFGQKFPPSSFAPHCAQNIAFFCGISVCCVCSAGFAVGIARSTVFGSEY